MTSSISLIAAFAAGLVSFLAPCTLALVPAYVSYSAGTSLSGVADGPVRRSRIAAILSTLFFTLGFTAVFVALGASFGAVSQALTTWGPWLNRVSGVLLIGFGLVTLGLLRIPLFERGFNLRFAPPGGLHSVGAFVIGATFALGWTPCVGPILGAILVLAGASGSAGQGAVLLTAFSLGLMVPFVAAGLMTGWTSLLLRRYGKVLTVTTHAGGIMLIGLGIAVFTGVLPLLSSYLALGA